MDEKLVCNQDESPSPPKRWMNNLFVQVLTRCVDNKVHRTILPMEEQRALTTALVIIIATISRFVSVRSSIYTNGTRRS